MNQQPLRMERPGASWRGLPHRPSPLSEGRACSAVVSISWFNVSRDGTAQPSASRIELKAGAQIDFGSAAEAVWTCEASPQSAWLEAIVASRCPELLLTASVDDSGAAKQAVLELAGLLTRRLEDLRPLIRVRFVPRPREHRAARLGRV